MPYQSIYAGKSTATVPNSNKANPFAADFKPGQYARKAAPAISAVVVAKPASPPKPQSLLSKIGNVAKSVGNSAVSGERVFATGIARDLPGGTNDLQANQAAAQQATKNIQLARTIKNPVQSTKLINQNTAAGSTASKNNTSILKAMPSKGQIGLGAASTAADILTAGEIPGLGEASNLTKDAVEAGAYGTAGALNSAASGGNKKQVVENFATGAVLPGALHLAGKGVSKAVEGVTGGQPVKDAVANAKARSLLDLAQHGKSANLDVNTAKSVNSIMSKVHTPKSVIDAAQADADAKATGQVAAEKSAKETQKNVEQGQKLDNQIELIKAKKADGKFTNVDKVKIKQLETQKQELGVPAVTATEVHPLTQAIDKVFKGGNNGPEEAKALAHVRANPEQTMATYNDIVKQKFGASNVVSGDEAKYAIPGFDSTKSVAYHEPASALAKVKYQQLLDDSATKDKPVLLMAGGSGAGKTSALKNLGINYDNYAAVVDTNSNKLESAKTKVEQALKSGRHIEVFYVHRDPIKAFKEGVIPRGKEEGRIVPVDTHIDTHYGSHDVVHRLAEKYKDNPKVEFTVASNNHGHGNARPITLDQVPKMRYTREEIHPILKKEVDNALTEGKISQQEHTLYNQKQPDAVGETRPDVQTVESKAGSAKSGQPEPQRTAGPEKTEVAATKSQKISNSAKRSEYKPGKPEPVRVPYPEKDKAPIPQINTTKLSQGVEANAVKKGLVEGFEGKAEYAKVNIPQQTKGAVDLLKADPEQAVRVAMGQAKAPGDLLPESVFIAVENAATKSGDTELLRKLATESHLTAEASGMGQRIRMLGERENTSPVAAIKQIADARRAVAEKRLGKPVNKAISQEVRQIRAAKPKVTKETFASFVDSLRC